MRSPTRKMRVYANPWFVLVHMVVLFILSVATVMGSHLIWETLLKADPNFLEEAPKFRNLVLQTPVPQIILSVVLIVVWFIGLRRSHSLGMRFVPSQFLKKLDDVIARQDTPLFAKEFQGLMRHRQGLKGSTNMDLLVRTVLDDPTRRRDLYYCLARSSMPTAMRYLMMRRNEAMYWSFWTWLIYFFYAHLFLPFLIFPTGRWVPGIMAFLQSSPGTNALAAIGTIVTLGHTLFSFAKSVAGEGTRS